MSISKKEKKDVKKMKNIKKENAKQNEVVSSKLTDIDRKLEQKIVSQLNKRNKLTLQLDKLPAQFGNVELKNLIPKFFACKFIVNMFPKKVNAISVEFENEQDMKKAEQNVRKSSQLRVKEFKRDALSNLNAYDRCQLVLNNLPACADEALIRQSFPEANQIAIRKAGGSSNKSNERTNQNQIAYLKYSSFAVAAQDFFEKNGIEIANQSVQVLFKKLPKLKAKKKSEKLDKKEKKKNKKANKQKNIPQPKAKDEKAVTTPLKIQNRKRKMEDDNAEEHEETIPASGPLSSEKPIVKPKLKMKKVAVA